MNSTIITAEGHLDCGQQATFVGAALRRLADIRSSLRHRSQVRGLCRQLESMDDRLLRDIGLDESDIARLRAGERFVPSLVQPCPAPSWISI